MSINDLKLNSGSMFEYKGFTYTLVKVVDGGWEWMDATGHFALTQSVFFEDIPTVQQVVDMAKYLP